MRVIGYIRVSTNGQGASGAGLDAQEQAIRAECQHRGWELVSVAQEVASGASMDKRDALNAAIAAIEAGDADALVAAKLDRLSRSMMDFATMLERARAKRWKIIVLDLGLDMSSPQGEFVAGIMVSVAQFERRLIGERTKAALAVRKAQGIVPGPKRKDRSDLYPLIRQMVAAKRQGWTYRRIAAQLNDEGIPGAGGGKWDHGFVRRLMLRYLEDVGETL